MRHDTSTCHTAGTYFFTARTARSGHDIFLRNVDLLRAAMRQTRARHPFEIEEIVVLGDVIHTLWTLPVTDRDYAKRWRMLKTLFSRACLASDVGASGRLEKGCIWQRRIWEHAIQDAADFEAHRQMIFSAPVQAGLVENPLEWPHGSIHRAALRSLHASNTHARGANAAWQGCKAPASIQTTAIA